MDSIIRNFSNSPNYARYLLFFLDVLDALYLHIYILHGIQKEENGHSPLYSIWKVYWLSKKRMKIHMYAGTMKNVVALIGSAATSSANHILIEFIRSEARDIFQVTV